MLKDYHLRSKPQCHSQIDILKSFTKILITAEPHKRPHFCQVAIARGRDVLRMVPRDKTQWCHLCPIRQTRPMMGCHEMQQAQRVKRGRPSVNSSQLIHPISSTNIHITRNISKQSIVACFAKHQNTLQNVRNKSRPEEGWNSGFHWKQFVPKRRGCGEPRKHPRNCT